MGLVAENREVLLCLSGKKTHTLLRSLHAETCNKIGLSGRVVPPQCLSDRFLIARHIKEVIGDLVGETEVLGKAGKGLPRSLIGAANNAGSFY